MVDIHCHILPEVDDGAKDWPTALEMCRLAEADGIDHIVASPHANDEFQYDRDRHEERLQKLRESYTGSLSFTLGCDFHFSYDNIQDAIRHPERYRIGGGPYLLVEFSDFALPPRTGDHLATLMQAGLVPIVTHPERNPILQRNLSDLIDWVEQGVLVQITGNSLTGRWGSVAKRTAERLIAAQAVHVVATDAHGVKDRRPELSPARAEVAKLAGAEAADALFEHNPRAIVQGGSRTSTS